MFRRAFPGLVAQVTNIPIDLRIEHWLRDGYPALLDAQRVSLLGQLEVNRGVLRSDVAQITPPTIYRASCALNCAFARGVAALYGEPELADPYRETPYWGLAGSLVAALGEMPNDAEGDVAAVDRWAGLLGVRGWYQLGPPRQSGAGGVGAPTPPVSDVIPPRTATGTRRPRAATRSSGTASGRVPYPISLRLRSSRLRTSLCR